ncbi:transcriptional regulator, TetR family [Desulfarculus baarsii DSM 2075]|uniref:Transcriptional regulator, TetR family n=1 Tax=Desulfarculus baarsii (strain ATCC 33931 / DSM 2075 / LMG 7858 / VKM B-1802 / 2st14) TaxID=644282 RepID=E1QDJ5_DESB2|nr:TetR/AcrR family transcriptional regulator C-terminal domain-containing protein [Desulfarculus baarsii]ADK83514.1 transcriptional regulator, TetR family [Desulfarculus baarsii DSM 2075]
MADNDIRLKIIEAASEIYERKGRQATVEEIAAAAGVSVPVTTHHLRKPSDIMLVIMEHLQAKFAEGVSANTAADATSEQKLRQAVAQFYTVVDQQRAKVLLVYRESRTLDAAGRKRIMQLELECVEVFRRILEEGVAQGAFRTMDTGLVAYDIVIMGHMWSLKSWHFKKIGRRFDDFLARQQEAVVAMVKR